MMQRQLISLQRSLSSLMVCVAVGDRRQPHTHRRARFTTCVVWRWATLNADTCLPAAGSIPGIGKHTTPDRVRPVAVVCLLAVAVPMEQNDAGSSMCRDDRQLLFLPYLALIGYRKWAIRGRRCVVQRIDALRTGVPATTTYRMACCDGAGGYPTRHLLCAVSGPFMSLSSVASIDILWYVNVHDGRNHLCHFLPNEGGGGRRYGGRFSG